MLQFKVIILLETRELAQSELDSILNTSEADSEEEVAASHSRGLDLNALLNLQFENNEDHHDEHHEEPHEEQHEEPHEEHVGNVENHLDLDKSTQTEAFESIEIRLEKLEKAVKNGNNLIYESMKELHETVMNSCKRRNSESEKDDDFELNFETVAEVKKFNESLANNEFFKKMVYI